MGDYNHANITDLLVEGSDRGLITDTSFFSLMLYYTNGTFKYTRLEEKIISDHYGFMFTVNHFIFKALNSKVVQLVESGIADRNVKDFCSRCKSRGGDNDEPAVLTLDHLGIWFLIWIGFMIVCFVSFLGELVTDARKKRPNQILRSSSTNRFERSFFLRRSLRD